MRGETFVTRKITRALSRIKLGLQDCLYLGNLDAKRDWGHAKDYIEMQWLMLQQDEPKDFVIATGEQYSVRDFINLAAEELDMKISWSGEGLDEKCCWENMPSEMGDSHKPIIVVDPRFFRPTEVESLLGDASLAKNLLGWQTKVTFKQLVSEMTQADFNLAKKNELIKRHGFKVLNYNE